MIRFSQMSETAEEDELRESFAQPVTPKTEFEERLEESFKQQKAFEQVHEKLV